MDAQAQAQPAGRNAQALAQDDAMSCYLLCFVFCHFVIRYPRTKTISRKDAQPMYPRYLRVFSLCHDLLPTPPPISVRKAGGITVVYLCGF